MSVVAYQLSTMINRRWRRLSALRFLVGARLRLLQDIRLSQSQHDYHRKRYRLKCRGGPSGG